MNEMVNHPAHYQGAGGVEVIDVIEFYDFSASWHLSDALKYLLRAGKKGGPEKLVEDLKKARFYMRRWQDHDFVAPAYSGALKFKTKHGSELTLRQVVSAFSIDNIFIAAAAEMLLMVGNDQYRQPRTWLAKALNSLDGAIAELEPTRDGK